MAFVSFPIITNNIIYRNTMQISHVNPVYTIHKNSKKITANNAFGNFHPPFSGQPLIQRRHRELLMEPIFCAKNSPEGAGGQDQQDPRTLEKLLKLYEAMKNKDVLELSEVIADEPVCAGNLSSIIQPLRGKKKVVDFFLNLIRHLGTEIDFFVKPTLHDGMKVGVEWALGWSKTHTPFGKGFSYHISHHYKGKVVIKNAEMFTEPLRHIPSRMKMMEIMTALTEKMGSNAIFKGWGSKVALSILLVFIIAAFLITLMLISH
ncbi:putative NTF2-like domain-containing protein [Rosa chinensis]|uniref:Putative NTF2-like domain-containing protein n=2 Tax=Rosa chinensis TaxID=74649 RepID=A0A2P6Q266_ROSCH|nr:uncharacterized protein LOC112166102 isoform X1 [Rosa chinensis]PRQ28288.1 putative NTF2-like domain-containing protein [Rosa chinensis]